MNNKGKRRSKRRRILVVEETLAEKIVGLVRRSPGLTEKQITKAVCGPEAYQQRVNPTCRKLIRRKILKRSGRGGPSDPFTYTIRPPKRTRHCLGVKR